MDREKPNSYASNQAQETGVQDAPSSSQELVLDILKQASLSARKGDFLQAENLLKTISDGDNARIEVIDLLAKVYAQQGKIDQAQTLWLKALQQDPYNIHFLSALRMCAFHKRPKTERFVLQYSWLLLAIVLWYIITVVIIIGLYM